MAGPDDNRLRTLKDAAKFLEVSEATIYRLSKSGELELIKIGRGTRVTQASLDRYVANATRMVPNRKG
jgi:excisionase family DNA binding protein